MDIIAEFEKYDDKFLKFQDLENKRSQRPDLHAFILLDELDPGNRDVISASEHDEIWLSFDLETVASKITVDQVEELVRCGVRIDDYEEGFAMFA